MRMVFIAGGAQEEIAVLEGGKGDSGVRQRATEKSTDVFVIQLCTLSSGLESALQFEYDIARHDVVT